MDFRTAQQAELVRTTSPRRAPAPHRCPDVTNPLRQRCEAVVERGNAREEVRLADSVGTAPSPAAGLGMALGAAALAGRVLPARNGDRPHCPCWHVRPSVPVRPNLRTLPSAPFKTRLSQRRPI